MFKIKLCVLKALIFVFRIGHDIFKLQGINVIDNDYTLITNLMH